MLFCWFIYVYLLYVKKGQVFSFRKGLEESREIAHLTISPSFYEEIVLKTSKSEYGRPLNEALNDKMRPSDGQSKGSSTQVTLVCTL